MGRPRKPIDEQLNTSAATKLDPPLFIAVKRICEEKRWTVSTFMREAAAEYVKAFKRRAKKAA